MRRDSSFCATSVRYNISMNGAPYPSAIDMARTFRLLVQLHCLIHIRKWTKMFHQITLQVKWPIRKRKRENFRTYAEKGQLLPLPASSSASTSLFTRCSVGGGN